MKKFATGLLVISLFTASNIMAQNCTRQASNFTIPTNGFVINGTATLVDSSGQLYIKFSSNFSTNSGPDLYVFFGSQNINPTDVSNNVAEVAKLTSNTGAQIYQVPANIGMDDYDNILIHCKQYNHFWGGSAFSATTGNCTATVIQQNDKKLQTNVFPNPCKGSTTLYLTELSDVIIMDEQGREVFHQQLKQGDQTIGESLPAGLYLIKVSNANATRSIGLIKE